MTYIRCRIDIINSSDDGHIAVRNMYRIEINMHEKELCVKLVIYKHSVGITSIYQPTNAHIISHKTLLKHFKTLRHVSILSDHHQGALFLAKLIFTIQFVFANEVL